MWSPDVLTRSRGRLAAGAVAVGVTLAACGGSDSPAGGARTSEPLPEVNSADGGSSTVLPVTPTAVGATYVDLVGPDVAPASEVDTNRLPNVVVDDLNNDRKVNFRNLVPQDRPVLLWMWAPR